jgi:circadian clock protein KaiC
MSVKRLTTGIKELDGLVQGGFKQNSINLVAGGPGTGKSIFAMQFIVEGIKRGDPGIYITFEEKKNKTYEDMLSFGWDLAKFEKEGKFAFLEYTPEQVKQILTEGGGIVESVIEKIKAKRLVIDSITSFALLYEDELTKKEAALDLFELINSWKCTGLLTSQSETRDDTIIGGALEFEADSIILLYHFKKKGIRKRAIEVLKMRGTKITEKTFDMQITNKGMIIDPKKVDVF